MDRPTKIQLFPTCLVNEFYPETGLAIANIFERLDIIVEVPPDTVCCGQPAFNAGLVDEARNIAESTLNILAKTDGPVIFPSGSCTHMVRHNYSSLFRNYPELLRISEEISSRCFELTEYVFDIFNTKNIHTQYRANAVYHPSCHLTRGLGIRHQPETLLKSIDGLVLKPFEFQDECCGFGGTFSVKHPEISAFMMNKKLDAVEASGADLVIGCDTGCLMHMEGGLRRRNSRIRTIHIAHILNGRVGT